MLVLTRKPGEHIVIGDEIRVSVISIKGHKVRLGISAPNEFLIRREELLRTSRDGFEGHVPAPAAMICEAGRAE